jgi:hypothetical protein
MAKKQIVFRTSGFVKTYVSTTGNVPFVLSSGKKVIYAATTGNSPIVLTSGKKTSFFQTTSSWPIVKTPGAAVAFVVTPSPNPIKDLVPKEGTLEFTGDYTIINVPDATGDYNASTNQGGYNVLPAPYNPYRPYRENVSLWTVYKIWNVYGDDTQTPDAQAEADDVPYLYPLSLPTEEINEEDVVIKGIYEIILIAAPKFNASDSEGTYASESGSAQTGYVVTGAETNFTSLSANDYLYYFDASNGGMLPMEQVLKVFSDTLLALNATATNTPASGTTPKLYGSATSITTNPSSGSASSLTTGIYYNVVGTGTDFSNFSGDQYIYYIDSVTNDYVYLGQFFKLVNPGQFNLYNKNEDAAPTTGDLVLSSTPELASVINSNGTFDTSVGTSIFGTGTDFTKFTAGQTLYYQDATTGLLYDVAVIDAIISETELTIASLPVFSPVSGDRLYASDDASITLTSSGGTFSSISGENTYYTLTANGGSFNTFNVADYVYIVSPEGVYSELGQLIRIESNDVINFYNVQDIQVNEGDFVVSSGGTALSLIDITGTFEQYDENSYYNVEGTGTSFLTTAEPEQYLFYLDSATDEYVLMGQIYQVFDDTNVWLYNVPTGSVTTSDTLFTSYSLNTSTAIYADYIDVPNLYDIAKELPDWYVTSVGVMVDDEVVNCLARMRYEFLQEVMCGKCPEGYLNTYAIYVGMLNAMEIQDRPTAIDFYNKLKTICREEMNGSSCGC